ncbi:MAG: hypothetical protein HYU75_26445 [Betaproteobacteria bacterium]|nr:hypothetical protein [Betaproteobacteria bacterium]
MKLAREDLRRLRLPTAAAIVMALIGAASILVTERYYSLELRQREISFADRKAAQERVAKVAEEEREIRVNLVRYRELVDRGMVGPERRLDWIDAITGIKNSRRLFEIRYAIEPQRSLDYPGMAAKGGAGFMVSRMKLEMMLLHEGDLLGFLADLNAAGKAYVSVRGCDITRAEQGAASRTISPKLRASCVVDLITLPEGKSA